MSFDNNNVNDFKEDVCTDPDQLDPDFEKTSCVLDKLELIKEDYEGKSVFTRHCNAEQCTLEPIEGKTCESIIE